MVKKNKVIKDNKDKKTRRVQRDKNGVIVEQSDEGSDEEYDPHKRSGWQEILEENMQLRGEVQTQILIFEQYLKVALL